MAYLLVSEKGAHVSSLISRQLNDLSVFFVLRDGTITVKSLLEGTGYSLGVEVTREALNDSKALTTTSLLHSEMDFRSVLRLLLNGKRIYKTNKKVINGTHVMKADKQRVKLTQHIKT
jgi:hypothetical protein